VTNWRKGQGIQKTLRDFLGSKNGAPGRIGMSESRSRKSAQPATERGVGDIIG
jgi:hypothetical protein